MGNIAKEKFCHGLPEKDIIEKFIRSSASGGQNVNKTSTCVYLKHIPTGIEVKCSRERYQALNRVAARRILEEKVRAFFSRIELLEKSEKEKIRRKMRKRPMHLKLKILEEKRLHARKKQQRAKIRDPDGYAK